MVVSEEKKKRKGLLYWETSSRKETIDRSGEGQQLWSSGGRV